MKLNFLATYIEDAKWVWIKELKFDELHKMYFQIKDQRKREPVKGSLNTKIVTKETSIKLSLSKYYLHVHDEFKKNKYPL